MAAVLLGCAGLRAADYHFAEGGSDANDGLAPATALRTIDRLNALDLKPGDRVLFRRGDLFRGAIKARNGVTYGAYGDGDELPTICASKRDYADPKLWERTDEPNVWRCTEKLHNVGIVLFDREPRRIDGTPVVADMRLPKRSEPFDKPVVLDVDLTFRNLFHEDRLELRSDKGNPGARFRHIEIGEHGHCLWINADDLLIEYLHLTLSGSHGVGGSGERRNVTVRNCRIDWLGGSIIEGWKFGTVRFGNAIEIWGGCDGFYALDNRIANVYDTGVTIQCNDRENFVCRMENVLFASNVIDNCFWGLEYYNRNNAPGSFTRNVRFVGNLCRGTGRGWGCKGREARAPAISIGETPEGSSGNVVEGNRFLGSTGPLVTLREPVAKGSWSFRGNVYAQRPGGILVSREPPLKTFAASSVEKVRPQTFPFDARAAETVRRELGDTVAVTTTLPSVRADEVFGSASVREWEDPSRQAQNRLPQHAWFGHFPDVESAKRILSSESPWTLSLDSENDWRFAWCRRPSERPVGFERPSYDVSSWEVVKVPCSWQADGIRRSGGRFGTPVYINQPYLFTSEFPAPTNVWPRVTGQPIPPDWTLGPEDNPVGCYRRDFELPADWVGDEIRLQFDGVESFFYLWVNGTYVGFAKDSRAVAAFDVTRLVRPGKNTVALEVYRHCDGSYLECQDTFRLSGIIRPVSLRRMPKTHLSDVTIVTEPVVRGAHDGDWKVRLSVSVAGGEPRKLGVRAFDAEDREVPFEGAVSPSCELTFRRPKTWSAECPNLYALVVSLEDGGRVTEASGFQLGFRQVEITDPPRQCDRTFLFNGKPIKLKGVNRGECDPLYGHHVPDSRLEQDLTLIKRGNFNHIRNSHFPQGERFYHLCNKLGIYVMDEANVESHGSQYGECSPSHAQLWLSSHLARMEAMLERSKNHPCVVIWSMGNEAGPGDAFKACYAYLKRRDPTRPVQYERNNWLTDMGSRQYPGVDWVRRCAAGDPALTDNVFEKDRPVRYPYHINEYAHNYNNASGNLGDFQAAIESSDRIMGGAIWDWADQTLLTEADGRRIYGWGGTWREKPEEGQGILDGIVTGDRRPEPSYYEAQHVFQNFSAKLSDDGRRIVLTNRHYFRSSEGFACRLTKMRDGRPCGNPDVLAVCLPPQGRTEIPLPPDCDAARIEFALKKAEGVWPAGWVVARDQVELPRRAAAFVPPIGEARFVPSAADKLSVRTGDWTYSFSRQTGELVSRRRSDGPDGETLRSPVTLDAFRMPVGGETFYREGPMYFGRERARDGLACLRPALRKLETVERDADGACVVKTVVRYQGARKLDFPRYGHQLHTEILDLGPVDANAPGYEVASTWRFYGRGVVRLTSSFRQFGRPTKVSRLGWRFVFDAPRTDVKYYARGPVDNYPDRPSGALRGRYEGQSDSFGGDYSASQDTGCREQAEEVELAVPGLTVAALGRPFSFQVSPYAPLELVREPHPEFLPKPAKTELGVYAAVRGLGSANCGPPPLPCHEIDPQTSHLLDVVLRPAGE